jgi:putative membrane protein
MIEQETAVPVTTTQQKTKRTLRDYMGLAIRGMAMGASDIVPGVSGGTMALILGIYEELIDSIRMIGQPEFLRAVLKFRIKDALAILNWQFMLAISLGIGLAILTLSHLLEQLLVNQPVYLWSFFFGLVLASVLIVSKRVRRWTPVLGTVLIIGAVASFLLVGLVPARTPETWWFLFLSGALAICAMILPGISGAFILVLLGKYEYVLSAVNGRDLFTLTMVAAGALIGLVTFAQILSWLFKKYHDGTIALLLGLMIGSLRKVWPWKKDEAWLTDTDGSFVLDSFGERIVTEQADVLPMLANRADIIEFAFAVGLAVVGFRLILLLDRLANNRKA